MLTPATTITQPRGKRLRNNDIEKKETFVNRRGGNVWIQLCFLVAFIEQKSTFEESKLVLLYSLFSVCCCIQHAVLGQYLLALALRFAVPWNLIWKVRRKRYKVHCIPSNNLPQPLPSQVKTYTSVLKHFLLVNNSKVTDIQVSLQFFDSNGHVFDFFPFIPLSSLMNILGSHGIHRQP